MSTLQLMSLDARPFVGVRREVPVTELATFFAEVLPKVMAWVAGKGLEPASRPMAMWCAMDMETGIADCHAGCFLHEAVDGEGEITAGVAPACEALVTTHSGPYDSVGQSWMAAYAEAKALGRAPGAGWEIYVDDPADTPAAELRTRIHLPLA